MGFSLIQFRKNRRWKRMAGIVMFWGGLAMLMIDVTTYFPTPVRGKFAAWWVIVIAVGAVLWVASKRLPLEQTIEVAKYCYGELRVTDLTAELNVTIDTAERILQKLEQKGYARAEDRDEVRVWVFPDIKSSIRRRQEQHNV
jgi:hypothetical protein